MKSIKRNLNWIVIPVVLLLVYGCGSQRSDKEKTPLVKVYDKYLYYEDIEALIPQDGTKEDSAVKVSNFIDIWVKKQLMLKKAELYLSNNQKDVEQQIEDYRASLLIYKYKQKFIEQKLDTVIPPNEIEAYYLQHGTELKLTTHVFKGVYVKILKSVPDLNRLRYWLRSNTAQDSAQMIEFCRTNATKFDNFNGNWMQFTDVFKEFPVPAMDNAEFLKNRTFYEAENERFIYFLKIKDYRLAGAPAPLMFIENDIKNIILNKRKTLLINELEVNIYQTALDKGNLEFIKQ